ncbi:hypothetical protein [Gluconobacter sp. GP1]|uniref:hypothetical protein n=1 Tax=Gluconobacter sp. GP1 TaxID=3046423 RepID=UPI00293E227C|nr:hypothetical protein [Gluconobacter sp. GP1]
MKRFQDVECNQTKGNAGNGPTNAGSCLLKRCSPEPEGGEFLVMNVAHLTPMLASLVGAAVFVRVADGGQPFAGFLSGGTSCRIRRQELFVYRIVKDGTD